MDHVPDQPDPAHTEAHELRIAALLRAVEAPAPSALHAHVAALVAPSAPRRRRRRRRLALALGGVMATAALVLVLIVVSGAPRAPTALRIAHVALERALRPAPRGLVAAGTSIVFPQWSAQGWPEAGTRSDRLAGRTVTTELYSSYADNGDATVGYSIVSGGPLRYGGAGRLTPHAGIRYWLAHAGAANIVVWVQDGHTCVLASRSTTTHELLALAVAEHDTAQV